MRMQNYDTPRGAFPDSPASLCEDQGMDTSPQMLAAVYRTPGREASTTWRMSREDKRLLEDEARSLGVSLQTLISHRVLGYPLRDLRSGPAGVKQERLPLTG